MKNLMGDREKRNPEWRDRVYHIPLKEFISLLNLRGEKLLEVKLIENNINVVDDKSETENIVIVKTRGE